MLQAIYQSQPHKAGSSRERCCRPMFLLMILQIDSPPPPPKWRRCRILLNRERVTDARRRYPIVWLRRPHRAGAFFSPSFFFSFRYSVMYSPATFVLRWWFVSDLLTEICACLSLEYFERWQVRKRERVGKGISVPCTPYPPFDRAYFSQSRCPVGVFLSHLCQSTESAVCVIACLLLFYFIFFIKKRRNTEI